MTGAQLKAWRVRRGLTQREVAEYLGVKERTLIRWESGEAKRGPRQGDIDRIMRHWPNARAS